MILQTNDTVMYIHLLILFCYSVSICILFKKMNYPLLFTLLNCIYIILAAICLLDITSPFYPALPCAALAIGVILQYKEVAEE